MAGTLFEVAGFPITLAHFLVAFYVTLYLTMEPAAAVIFAGMWFTMAHYSLAFNAAYGDQAAIYAAYIHILSWVMQFVGHGVCEGRKPALLDSLAQAFFNAPLFVLLETLFMFGYRPAL